MIDDPLPLVADLHAALATRMPPVVQDVLAERAAQDRQWGGPAHDDTHAPDEWLQFIEKQIERASDQIGGTDDGLGDTRYREALIKVAALAIAAVESLDRHHGDVLSPEQLQEKQTPSQHPRHPDDVVGSEYIPEACDHGMRRPEMCRMCALVAINELSAALARAEQANQDLRRESRGFETAFDAETQAREQAEAARASAEQERDELRRRLLSLQTDITTKTAARVSVEALRELQRYGIFAGWHTPEWRCVSAEELDALCANAGKAPADDELSRVTRQRDALQGEVERLQADQAGHDLIVTHALRTAQEQVEARQDTLEPTT